MLCPLCSTRRARRGCPALGKQICAVCCGTKRLVEINCPPDCPWLATAREHPPAVAVRQQQRDIALLVHWMRDFSERQSQLFVLINTFLVRYKPSALQSLSDLIDDDVAEGMGALAATFETASRGLIYDHRPTSLPAERLVAALKPLLVEAGRGAGSAFERDAAVVLRRLEESVGEVRASDPGHADKDNRRAFLELLARVIRTSPAGEGPDGGSQSVSSAEGGAHAAPPSRLIVP